MQRELVEITAPVTFRGHEYQTGDTPEPGHADRLIALGYAESKTPPEKPAAKAARKRPSGKGD